MNSHEISDDEIAREVRTLRNLRRRSGSSQGPGALPLDPDLPPPSPSASASSSSSSSNYPEPFSSNDDVTLASPDGLEGDAAGLFWVPAHLHPELAPGEFRAFLKSHTHAHPEEGNAETAGEAAGLARSPSWLARNGSRRGDGGLGRKRSMLSRQYNPKIGDNVEEEVPPLPARQRASIYGGRSGEKGLTLHDLQKLEELVDEAGEDNDPEHMRSLLRRSLSLNVAPGFLQDDIPAISEEGNDISSGPPRPGSILRRSARTKIRKASLAGDGGGHRFAATRKGRMTAAPVIDIPGLEDDDDGAARHHTGSDESEEALKDSSADSHEEEYHDARQHDEWQDGKHIEDMNRRPSDDSTETDENHIFDAYARDSRSSSVSGESSSRSESPSPEDDSPPALTLELPSIPRSTSGGQDWFGDRDGDKTPTQESVVDPLHGLRRPSPSEGFGERPAAAHLPGLPSLTVPGDQPFRGPGSPTTPQASRTAGSFDLPPGMAPPAQRSSVPPGIAQQQQHLQTLKESIPLPPTANLSRTDSAASSASSVSSVKEKESSKEKEKEKKGGFFSKKDKEKKSKKDKDGFLGSLFGGNKKKTEEVSSVSNFSSAGPAAAAALLGTSKSAKSLGHSPSPSPTSPAFSSFARYPIHVERAVYRLSHIKLANARRPLYEQVLISNLMFWYLGVIGRNVAEEKKEEERNGKEKEKEKTAPVKGTPPKPIDQGSAGQALPRERPDTVPPPRENSTPSGKKMGLTKPDRSRSGRDAEVAVRTPQYGMQNAQVDSEIRTMKGPRPPSSQSDRSERPAQSYSPQSSPYQQQQQAQPLQQQQQQQQQQQLQHPPSQQHQPPRALSTPPPQRVLSPPAPGGPRPSSDYNVAGPRDPRAGPGPGPAPPSYSPVPNGISPSHSTGDLRDVRQRTHSNPGAPPSHSPYPPHPGHPQLGRPVDGNMRRVVSEARPGQVFPPQQQARSPEGSRSPPPQSHAGPQPGQIFHHPGSPTTANFNRPPPGVGPPPGQGRGYPGPPGPGPGGFGTQPGQVFRPPPNAGGPRPQWEPPARLPPGAGTGHPQQQVPPHLRRPPGPGGPPGPTGPYDGRSFSNPYPGAGHPPPQMQVSHSGPGTFYQGPPGQMRPPPGPGGVQGGPQPGQIFNPYGGASPPGHPQRQGSGDEVYRRAQAVPQGYVHHR